VSLSVVLEIYFFNADGRNFLLKLSEMNKTSQHNKLCEVLFIINSKICATRNRWHQQLIYISLLLLQHLDSNSRNLILFLLCSFV